MGKYEDWGDCSLCPYKRPTRPIKRVRFRFVDKDKELVCDFCLSIIKDEAKAHGEEICQTCYNKSLKTWTVVLEDFYKPLNGDCPRCTRKIQELEEQLRQNQADNARTRQEIEENNRRNGSSHPNQTKKALSTCASCQKDISQETSYYFPNQPLIHWCADCYPKQNKPATNNSTPTPSSSPSSPHSTHQPNNPPPPVQTPNQQTNIKCYDCHKEFQQGENTHYLPYAPDKKWCDVCDLAKKRVYLQAFQQILSGQTVVVDQLNTTFAKKLALQVLVRLKKGDKINIDEMMGISEEDIKDLKEFQQQLNGKNQQGDNSLPWGKIIAVNVIFWPLLLGVVLIVRRQKRIRNLTIKY